MVNWDQLVKERNVWIQHNFPETAGPRYCVFGMIEELGELAHAHLKLKQGIRGDVESLTAEAQDAVADLLIYSLGLMQAWQFRPMEVPLEAYAHLSEDELLLRAAAALGFIATAVSQDQERAAGMTQSLIARLYAYSRKRAWDLDAVLLATWNHVKQRDWIKFPHNGIDA